MDEAQGYPSNHDSEDLVSSVKYVPVERNVGEYGRCALYVHVCGNSQWMLDSERDEVKGGCDGCESGSDKPEDWTPVFKAVPNTNPVFILKPKDLLTVPTVYEYQKLCMKFGAAGQAQQVQLAIDELVNWRHVHWDSMKLPDHPHQGVWDGRRTEG